MSNDAIPQLILSIHDTKGQWSLMLSSAGKHVAAITGLESNALAGMLAAHILAALCRAANEATQERSAMDERMLAVLAGIGADKAQ